MTTIPHLAHRPRGPRRTGIDRRADSRADHRTMALARGLGWFSIALGTLELVAPRSLDRSLGAPGHRRLTRAYGLRELAAGVGILTSDDPTPWVWSRVAGDALDLATMAPTLER